MLRAASLARYLPDEGIRLDILTARNASAVGSDFDSLTNISGAVTIHRTMTLDFPFELKKAIKNLIVRISAVRPDSPTHIQDQGHPRRAPIRDLLLPDPQVTWLPALTHTARRLVKARSIDLVIVTVPPFSSLLLVPKLRKAFPDVQIVADFRDEWLESTINLVSFSHSARARRIARDIEANAVANSTAVVMVTEAACQTIRSRYPEETENKFQVIPNGYDAGMQKVVPTHNAAARRDDRIIFTYIGSLYRSTDPRPLVNAIQSLPSEIRSRMVFRFVGHIEDPIFRNALLQLGEAVELRGFVPQSEAVATLGEGDYALLISHDSLNVSAKFYDYIGAGIPIVALVRPRGAVQQLLDELRAGWWADSSDTADIQRLFRDVIDRGNPPVAAFQPNVAKIAQYERAILAKRYASFLHSIVRESRGQQVQEQTTKADMESC